MSTTDPLQAGTRRQAVASPARARPEPGSLHPPCCPVLLGARPCCPEGVDLVPSLLDRSVRGYTLWPLGCYPGSSSSYKRSDMWHSAMFLASWPPASGPLHPVGSSQSCPLATPHQSWGPCSGQQPVSVLLSQDRARVAFLGVEATPWGGAVCSHGGGGLPPTLSSLRSPWPLGCLCLP